MNFSAAIWKLVTAPCAGRKYQTAAESYLSICCSAAFVSFLYVLECSQYVAYIVCLSKGHVLFENCGYHNRC